RIQDATTFVSSWMRQVNKKHTKKTTTYKSA
ncbi:hypothetical protein HUSEC_26501, partial [Escherichia coli O104:H4 str. LB226692]